MAAAKGCAFKPWNSSSGSPWFRCDHRAVRRSFPMWLCYWFTFSFVFFCFFPRYVYTFIRPAPSASIDITTAHHTLGSLFVLTSACHRSLETSMPTGHSFRPSTDRKSMASGRRLPAGQTPLSWTILVGNGQLHGRKWRRLARLEDDTDSLEPDCRTRVLDTLPRGTRLPLSVHTLSMISRLSRRLSSRLAVV